MVGFCGHLQQVDHGLIGQRSVLAGDEAGKDQEQYGSARHGIIFLDFYH
jgi:hypothetical protein